jgi:hypothetical protein
MKQYGENIYTRIGHDRSHYGKYEVELEAGIPGYIDPIKAALDSSGYILADFDQWGITYFSSDDSDLSVNVDELDDYGAKFRIILRKGTLLEYDINEAKRYLQRIYYEILSKIYDEPVETLEDSPPVLLPTY